MGGKERPIWNIRASKQQRAELLDYLIQENVDRLVTGLPAFDVEERLRREIVELEDALFNDKLRPFVESGVCRGGVCPGIVGQAMAHIGLYDAGALALRSATGLVRPHPVAFDIEKFMLLYRTGRLDAWGGAFTLME